MMRKVFTLVFAFLFMFVTTAFAAEKMISATGMYIAGASESLNDAKQNALQDAMRQATEQAGVLVNSYSKTHNMELTDDEVTIVATKIIKVINKKYTVELISDSEIKIIVYIDALIDTDSINEDIVKLKAENNELKRQKQEVEEQRDVLSKLNNISASIKQSYKRKVDLKSNKWEESVPTTVDTSWKVHLNNYYIEMDHGNFLNAHANIQAAIGKYIKQTYGERTETYIDGVYCELLMTRIRSYLASNDYVIAIEHLIRFVNVVKRYDYYNCLSEDIIKELELYGNLLIEYFNVYEPDKWEIIRKMTS